MILNLQQVNFTSPINLNENTAGKEKRVLQLESQPTASLSQSSIYKAPRRSQTLSATALSVVTNFSANFSKNARTK